MSADRLGEIETPWRTDIQPHDDRAMIHVRELLRDGRPLDDYDAKALLARLDRAEAALATEAAAGFARGVEAAAETVFASPDLRDDELTPYGIECRAHAQRIRALLPRVTP